jgi:hypothetical protein
MNGFLEHAANKLNRNDPDTLKVVHENGLIVLYRLLFTLYAEDRDLLPCEDKHYTTYSLRELHRGINKKLRHGDPYVPSATTLWSHLCNLFALIDEGFRANGQVIIPAYNGGLFSPSKYPAVAHTPLPDVSRWEVGDHRLAEVIDMLAYERERWSEAGTRDIDYGTLGVQHLGSIYEGLLELQPRVADEGLVETLEKGKPIFRPEREVAKPRVARGQQPRRIAQGEVYLITDRGERKATGSYYTPKYIVDYIVENTVGPLADRAAEQVADLLPDVKKDVGKLERTRHKWEQEANKGNKAEAEKHIADLSTLVEEQKRRLLDPYLSLNILDPAMGSGHFLVGAADFLSLAMATDPNLPDLAEIGDEDPQEFYKRLVVERCLYGVDLNPLAVELAKLSLWLHTVSRDKALSFLDHHLRCGNSVIGARMEDLAKEPPQVGPRGRLQYPVGKYVPIAEVLTGKHLQYFLDTFHKIVETPTGDAETERRKDTWYRHMDDVRDRFRSVANCWLVPYFATAVTPEQYETAVKALSGTDADLERLAKMEWFRQAQIVANHRHFFHWELEFPDVFFLPTGLKPEAERGFDAVIGNPPYVRVRRLRELGDPALPWYESGRFECAHHVYDLYLLFLEQARGLLASGGFASLIVPVQTLHQPNCESVRRLLTRAATVRCVVETGSGEIFEGALVRTSILVFESRAPFPDDGVALVDAGGRQDIGQLRPITVAHSDLSEAPGCSFKPSLHKASAMRQRLYAHCQPLADVCYVTFGRRSCAPGKGKGGKGRLIETKASTKASRPYLEGREIRRYSIDWVGRYIKYLPDKMYSPRVPELFEGLKIVSQSMLSSKALVATIDDEKHYVEQSLVCAIPHGVLTPPIDGRAPSLHYILALMNSRLLAYYYGAIIIGESLGGGLIHATPGAQGELPIRRIHWMTPDRERTAVAQELKAMYKAASRDGILAQVEQLLPKDAEDNFLGYKPGATGAEEKSDVVHDFLAFLAEQMIEMNKTRHAEVKGFAAWLERQIGAKTDDLSHKTEIETYHEHDFNVLLDVLKKNRRKLKVNPDTRAVQEAIEAEFNKSMAKLEPLKAKIAATDRLIDLIVYRLYGLTEDEIQTVEGEPVADARALD